MFNKRYELKIKTTVRYHFTLTRMAKIKDAHNAKHWPGELFELLHIMRVTLKNILMFLIEMWHVAAFSQNK